MIFDVSPLWRKVRSFTLCLRICDMSGSSLSMFSQASDTAWTRQRRRRSRIAPWTVVAGDIHELDRGAGSAFMDLKVAMLSNIPLVLLAFNNQVPGGAMVRGTWLKMVWILGRLSCSHAVNLARSALFILETPKRKTSPALCMSVRASTHANRVSNVWTSSEVVLARIGAVVAVSLDDLKKVFSAAILPSSASTLACSVVWSL
mmetsp:Transcript_56537/g.134705  ORF Transcript_56537/g.134705 Transcript_56537/m.134705 type:complete len:203 (-) Transcript_56537:805-1413(-)